ncbi:MAG: family 1 glycosylhydrolase [Anaerolineae bacterium]|nr:family 1 glycosylhydrolase [Anaerolineae bacterium]
MIDFTLTFPAGFLWGATTAAHQVEGGSAPNTWTAWEQRSGRIHQDGRASLACDWWGGRYAEDFDRAAALQHNAHRFSVEWSRIEPERGRFDGAAIAHYADMIAALRARHMEPLLTLHHFTDPLWVAEQGGWLNPDTAHRFARFAQILAEDLGGGVTMWCTINAPLEYAMQGYWLGRFPPGERSLSRALDVAEGLLRGHAAAYAAIKAVRPGAQIGLAARQISLLARRPSWLHGPARNRLRHLFNRALVEALLTGELRFLRRTVAVPEARDTLDWIGLNAGSRFVAGFDLLRPRQAFTGHRSPRHGLPESEGGGEIWPEGLFEQIRWLAERAGKPLYITEHGAPGADDALRSLVLVRGLRSVWRALNHNYPVKGYFYRTLVDGFEWASGYDPRLRWGLFACDPQTQARAPRHSAALYGEICAANALTMDMVRRYLPGEADALFPGVPVQRTVTLRPRL